MLDSADESTPESGEEPSEDDLRRFAAQAARYADESTASQTSEVPGRPVPPPAGTGATAITLRPGPTTLAELPANTEAALGIHPLWLEPSGSLCDRATGRELVVPSRPRASFEGMELELMRPGLYRVRQAARTVYLRFKHRRWYHHIEETGYVID